MCVCWREPLTSHQPSSRAPHLSIPHRQAEECHLDESLAELRIQRYRPLLCSSFTNEVETCAICYEDMKSATCHAFFEGLKCGGAMVDHER